MVSYGEVFNPVFGHLDRYIPICVQKNPGGPPPAWPLMFLFGEGGPRRGTNGPPSPAGSGGPRRGTHIVPPVGTLVAGGSETRHLEGAPPSTANRKVCDVPNSHNTASSRVPPLALRMRKQVSTLAIHASKQKSYIKNGKSSSDAAVQMWNNWRTPRPNIKAM